jgi:phospholipase/carboxylesterase
VTPFLEIIEQNPGQTPTASVIWLHGLGADGYDFAGVPSQLGLPADLALRFVFPHAPRIPVTINMGLIMRAWYDIRPPTRLEHPPARSGRAEPAEARTEPFDSGHPEQGRRVTFARDRPVEARRIEVPGQDEQGIRRSAGWIRELIDCEVDRGVPAKRIVLAGFSQGGAMVLFTGLRYPERLAGIMCLSGYLLLADSLSAEASDANRGIDIFQAHGTYDDVVPFVLAGQSRDVLTEAGYHVDWHEYAMAHQVCFEELRDIGAWIKKALGCGL